MPRLIDADELWKHKFKSASERMDLDVAYMGGWNDAIDTIMDETPSVDAVEVVRCKDCEYWRDDDCKNDSHGYCPISENDFCSRGERREDAID